MSEVANLSFEEFVGKVEEVPFKSLPDYNQQLFESVEGCFNTLMIEGKEKHVPLPEHKGDKMLVYPGFLGIFRGEKHPLGFFKGPYLHLLIHNQEWAEPDTMENRCMLERILYDFYLDER